MFINKNKVTLTSRTKLFFNGKCARNESKGYISFIRHYREGANVSTFTEGTRQPFKHRKHKLLGQVIGSHQKRAHGP